MFFCDTRSARPSALYVVTKFGRLFAAVSIIEVHTFPSLAIRMYIFLFQRITLSLPCGFRV